VNGLPELKGKPGKLQPFRHVSDHGSGIAKELEKYKEARRLSNALHGPF